MKKLIALFNGCTVVKNPALILLLAASPLLAVSIFVPSGICLGVAAVFIFTCTGTVSFLVQKIIPSPIKTATDIVISAFFTTIAAMIIEMISVEIYGDIGIFMPIMAVTSLLLIRAGAIRCNDGISRTALDGLGAGLGFFAVIIVMSVIREVLGFGTFWGIKIFGEHFPAAKIIAEPVGGFLLLGVIVAVINYLRAKKGVQ